MRRNPCKPAAGTSREKAVETATAMDDRKATIDAHPVADEAVLRARLRELVRERPWLAVGVAGMVGGVLGGLVFSRAGRLVFIAAAGYIAEGLWQSEGRLDIDDLVGRLSEDDGSKRRTTG
jgi:hypothetical protein